MLEAVARGKANWLFERKSKSKEQFYERRPQEDMVTSSVFGSIKLLSSENRYKALELLLGKHAFKKTGFTVDHPIEIELWPWLTLQHQGVEPDVLLESADQTVVVEVKWYAPLGEEQLERQIEAVRQDGKTVALMLVLGKAGVKKQIDGVPCVRRTWGDVAVDLQNRPDNADASLEAWGKTVYDFLQKTDIGRIFQPLPLPSDVGQVTYRFHKPGGPPWFNFSLIDRDAGQVTYRFRKPGGPPWFSFSPIETQPVQYVYEERT